MTQPSSIISLAAVRARQAQQAAQATPPAGQEPPAPALRWQQSQRGNWWTRADARSGLHLALYETTQGWRGRARTPGSDGWYVDIPPAITTLAEAQAWAESWLGMQCIAGAAETRV